MSLPTVVVPQWQGSGSPLRSRLTTGATAVAALLGDSVAATVDVASFQPESSTRLGEQLPALVATSAATRAALRAVDGPALTLGGDCGVELAAVEHAALTTDRLAVVWFDAHADLNTAASSPSGTFHGMVARALLGDAPAGLEPAATVLPRSFVLAGARALDDAEVEYVRAQGITHLLPGDLLDPRRLLEALGTLDPGAVYLHIDMDVLDPAELSSTGFAEPDGMTVQALTACIRAVLGRYPLAGAGITEFSPASPEIAQAELPAVRAVLEALGALEAC